MGQKLPEQYRTHIQFIKPQYVRDLSINDRDSRNLKLIKLKVPDSFSDNQFCSFIAPAKLVSDMKPKKDAKHITWVQVSLRKYKKTSAGDLVPNMVSVKVKKDGDYKVISIPVDELNELHLKAVYKFKKKRAKTDDKQF